MDEPYADDADTGDVVARAEAVVARALAAHQGPFASTSTDDLIDSCERDLDALHHSGSLAYPLLASLDARLTVVLSRVHAPGAAEAVSDLADVTEYLLHTLGERRDEMCLLESDHQFQLKIAAGLLALDELPVANRPALHVPSFAAEDPDRFREFRDRLLADIEPSTEPERTWSTRTRNVLAQTGDRHRAALCLDWLTVAIDTSDWAATLAASVIGRYGTIVSMAAPNDAVCFAPVAPARFLSATTLGRATVLLTDAGDPGDVAATLLGIAVDPVRRAALVTHAQDQLGIWRSANMCHAAPG